MVKKLTFALAALMLLALCGLALAGQPEYQTYTAADGGLTFAYPEGWTLLSRENLETLLDLAENAEDMKAMVEGVRPQIERLGMVVLMSGDGTTNINVFCQDAGAELTAGDLLASATDIQAGIAASMKDVVFPTEPEITGIGDGQAMLIQYAYTLAGIDFAGVQAYMPVGTKLVMCTLTSAADAREGLEALNVILGSARPG